MGTSFSVDIRPKFRHGDLACMAGSHINLGDASWMCDSAGGAGYADHANARRVFSALSRGIMPPDGAWPREWLDTFKSWMDSGFPP
jgi:hypothetical protein